MKDDADADTDNDDGDQSIEYDAVHGNRNWVQMYREEAHCY